MIAGSLEEPSLFGVSTVDPSVETNVLVEFQQIGRHGNLALVPSNLERLLRYLYHFLLGWRTI